ncbi:agenet domain-containing protein [Tasmannia lanceolata]|uniref:agenet domain-containing protein n=1 Tax=Tasmannia lanceolata TaxID=3420 RepID=UPI0040643B92
MAFSSLNLFGALFHTLSLSLPLLQKPERKKERMGEEKVKLSRGAVVEVRSYENGFVGAWFEAKVIRSMPKKNSVSVEYKDLMDDQDESKPLRETVDLSNVRPPPPLETHSLFQLNDRVDAFWNEGWWVGVILKVLDEERYAVYFQDTKEEIEFERSNLRVHREWIGGKWVPNRSQNKKKLEMKFTKGTLVEVSSDEEGFIGCWFIATVVKVIEKSKFLVEYQSLRTDDETEHLTEIIDSFHIRPVPPQTPEVGSFPLLEEVDAFYNDGWWVGVISKVLRGHKYSVYFRNSKEEMEFRYSELRLHRDWIDGNWVRASQALKLSDN